jgi:Mor family transcriptional regulator
VDAVHKRPEVELVERLVVNVGGDGFYAKVGASVRLLLVSNVMLKDVGC